MRRFHPEKKQGKALYVQLGDFIIDLIREGEYRVGDKLPPVNMANGQLDVARDTIIKAYKYLQESGWVRSVPGKGFFVSKCQEGTGKNLFILFDAMNQYKETLYRSLLDSLGSEYHYDTAFHYYDRQLFERLINNALGKYDGYVIIPHFNVNVRPILRNIPAKRLLLLDAFPRNYDQPCSAVFQDFHKDIYEELNALHEKLQRYEALHVVYNDKFQFIPHELLGGMYQFCGETHYPIFIDKDFDMENLKKNHCYMAISERDLAGVVKVIQNRGWQLCKDIGLLSFDETALKEVLLGGITTISTDFEQMGRCAGELIRTGTTRIIANPWKLTDRGSL